MQGDESIMVFVVCIVKHCNLNCVSCDHFAPLSDDAFVSLGEYSRHINRMAEITNRNVELIDIEGGEPLLHPSINGFIEVTRLSFPKTRIKILTNGLLLSKMPKEFWGCCQKNSVSLKITKYPINLDYSMIENIAMQNGVEVEFFNNSVEKEMRVQVIDVNGNQSSKESYMNCYMSNGICAELKNDRLYTCTQSANMDIFAQYFGINIVESKGDYIDIYDDVCEKDIEEFLHTPVPMCRYCETKNWNTKRKWQVSEKRIEEWVGNKSE